MTEILSAADLLEDDLVPAVVPWFHRKTACLPDPMTKELEIWFDVMLHGSSTPPRRTPRSPTTTRLGLSWALPALKQWADDGHTSLREITKKHVEDVLPDSGTPRAHRIQGLRSIFCLLKGRRVLFANPTDRIRVGRAEYRDPLPLAPALVRQRLGSDNPAAALVAALLAFHALMPGQVRRLLLTNLRDGTLHIDDRVIPLAQPVRERLVTYLDHRQQRWPRTTNPYLLINQHTAGRAEASGPVWFHRLLGMTPRHLREDRILDEVLATGGNLRQVCDLFGISIHGAARYTGSLDHPALRHLFERAVVRHHPGS